MLKKRLTAAQRKRQQIKALEQRLTDIYSGAFGSGFGEYDGASAEDLSRIVPAVRFIFKLYDDQSYLTDPYNLHHYHNPKMLTEFLYEHGVRA